MCTSVSFLGLSSQCLLYLLNEVLGLSGVLQGLLVFSSTDALPQAARIPVLRHLLLLCPLLDFHMSCGFSKHSVSVAHHCHVVV